MKSYGKYLFIILTLTNLNLAKANLACIGLFHSTSTTTFDLLSHLYNSYIAQHLGYTVIMIKDDPEFGLEYQRLKGIKPHIDRVDNVATGVQYRHNFTSALRALDRIIDVFSKLDSAGRKRLKDKVTRLRNLPVFTLETYQEIHNALKNDTEFHDISNSILQLYTGLNGLYKDNGQLTQITDYSGRTAKDIVGMQWGRHIDVTLYYAEQVILLLFWRYETSEDFHKVEAIELKKLIAQIDHGTWPQIGTNSLFNQ